MLKDITSYGILALLSLSCLGWSYSAARKNNEGNECYQKGEYEQALKKYSEAMTEAPEKPELYFNVGNALYKQSKFPESLKLYERSAAPGDVKLQSKAFYNIRNSKFRTGKAGADINALQEAAACYVKALELNPGDRDAKHNLEFAQREIKKIQEQKKREEEKKKEEKKKKETKLRVLQKELSRKKKGSNRRQQAKTKVSKAYASLTRAKVYSLHQIANELVRTNDLIAVENLNVKGLQEKKGPFSRGLHRNIGLASWTTFFNLLSYKAEEAGRTFVKVDPRGTSQECSACGALVLKDLSVRTHACGCGLTLDRDQNAARNILQRALQAPRGGAPLVPGNRRDRSRKKSYEISGISA